MAVKDFLLASRLRNKLPFYSVGYSLLAYLAARKRGCLVHHASGIDFCIRAGVIDGNLVCFANEVVFAGRIRGPGILSAGLSGCISCVARIVCALLRLGGHKVLSAGFAGGRQWIEIGRELLMEGDNAWRIEGCCKVPFVLFAE